MSKLDISSYIKDLERQLEYLTSQYNDLVAERAAQKNRSQKQLLNIADGKHLQPIEIESQDLNLNLVLPELKDIDVETIKQTLNTIYKQ